MKKQYLIIIGVFLLILVGFLFVKQIIYHNVKYLNFGGEKLTKEQLENECQKVVDGKKSEFLEKNSGLYNLYSNSLEVLQKNEFEMFSNLKNGLCENFDDKNKSFCESYKSKDLKLVDNSVKIGSYEYVLLKSMIELKDNCSELKSIDEQGDCKKNYLGFTQLSKDPKSNDLLNIDNIERGKNFIKLGKEGYLNLLNSQFIDACKKLN